MEKDWRRGVCPNTGNTVEWFGVDAPTFCGEEQCKGDGVRPVINPEPEVKVFDYSKKAFELGYPMHEIGMHVWQLACDKHGVGGTPEARAMYGRIMKLIFKEANIKL